MRLDPRHRRCAPRGLAVLAAALAVLAAAAGTPAQAAPLKDVDDPFYRWAPPLQGVAPGTVLRTRKVTIAPAGVPTSIDATQVLYRTTKTSGAAVATVATIMRPALGGATRLVSYQTAYDDLGSTCTPSYTLQGGSTGAVTALEQGLMLGFLAQGDTVVTADYEGLTHDYTSGQGSGYAVLDAIRAARTVLGVPAATPVGMLGYSGGAIATQWASEIAPGYAPETNIVGAASGGIPVSYAHLISYIDGTEVWSSVLPYLLVGGARGAGIDLTRYLSARGREVTRAVSDKCLETEEFPRLRLSDLLEGGRDYRTLRPLVRLVNSQTMGTAGTPRAPVLLGNGDADVTGDGIMIAADVEALAHKYCRAGTPVQYSRYGGADHVGALPFFEAEATAFLRSRFAGEPPPENCADVGPRNGLELLPVPPLPRVLTGRVRRTSTGYAIPARIDASLGETLAVNLYVVRGGKRRRVATLRPPGTLTARTRPLAVPLRRGRPGRRYVVVVSAIADGERVAATRSFRAGTR